MNDTQLDLVFEQLGGVRDALAVGRVFGDPYRIDDTTLIPVAVVRGGGGGGAGEGTGPDEEGAGSGGGLGFGVNVRPIGVYRVQGGTVTWQPTIDVMRIVVTAQLCLVAALVLRRIFGRR